MVFGVGRLSGLVPFRTSPLFALVFVVLSFFSFCWDVRRRRFYLCLPFSLRCWGNPNPLRGLGFPLCFFFVATLSDLDPFILIRTFSEVRLQPLFFFFFSRRRRRSLVWWRSVAFLFRFFLVCGGGLLSVCLSCFWVGGLLFCLACKMYNAQFSHLWG